MKTIHYDASGGVVIHGDHVLVLCRPSRDEIRLPKGHVEEGESRQEAALREVTEESGYADLNIVGDLGHQVVEFDYKGKHVVRDEYYFAMQLTSPRQIERTKHERQFVPQWLSWKDTLAQLTFEAEREWVRRAQDHNVQKSTARA
jgi:8-oxo-dGTP pyrophosphatase MutT (NUDIX family)